MQQILFIVLLTGMAVFLILLVLIQRGRGGGLSGAFGGAGGQSAFGAKAGDTFTKITMWSAFLWIVLCTVAALVLPQKPESKLDGLGGKAPTVETGIGTNTNPEETDGPGPQLPPGTLGPDGQLTLPAEEEGSNE